MISISIQAFAEKFVKDNTREKKNEVILKLQQAVKDKQKGVLCNHCEHPIWAVGSAISGMHICFTCLTGEADDSDDFEVEEPSICQR